MITLYHLKNSFLNKALKQSLIDFFVDMSLSDATQRILMTSNSREGELLPARKTFKKCST
jgi:hypothetical protein